MYNCRIGKVKLKNGGQLHVLPESHSNYARVVLGDWGEVTFRCFDGESIKAETLVYMLEMVKQEVMYGDD